MSDFDIYRSNLAKSQLAHDAEDYRRALYTNTKPDHVEVWPGEGCPCERGDDAWERNGVAMNVRWPSRRESAPEAFRPQRSRGRSR